MPGFGANVVESPQRKMVVLSVKKRGLGTPTLSGSCANMFTITDNGVGDYTLVLKSAYVFANIPEVVVGMKTAVACHTVGTVTISDIPIKTFAMDGTTAKEADFDVLVIGSIAKDLY